MRLELSLRSRVAAVEGERDQALEAVGQLSAKTDSLEEQLENLGRLLEEARERVSEKAQQLQHAEVCRHASAGNELVGRILDDCVLVYP